MKLIILIFAFLTVATAFKPRNPLKTKKYKCIEVAEDEEVQIVKKKQSQIMRNWNIEDEELRPIGSAKFGAKSVSSNEEETIEMPQAHKVVTQKPVPATTPQGYPTEVKKDKNGKPLILSPEHCKQVKQYSNQYGVTDVQAWVHKNCSFARMYLPGATCEEIDLLVASCYKNKFL